MKVAILLLCHKNEFQIRELVRSFRHTAFDFYVHVDASSSMDLQSLTLNGRVHVLDLSERVRVRWGTISMVDATLRLLKHVEGRGYDFVWLMSGQDFPLRSPDSIVSWLQAYAGGDFIDVLSSDPSKGGLRRFAKRNEIVFPGWVVGKALGQRVAKRLWVQLTGGYRATYSLFARRSACEIAPFFFGSQWWCLRGGGC